MTRPPGRHGPSAAPPHHGTSPRRGQGPLGPGEREDQWPELRAEIDRGGYYPDFVAEAVEAALAGEPLLSWVVHQETTFDTDAVRRHVTVLALTPTRLVVGHTDDHGDPAAPEGAADAAPGRYATTSTETVRLDRVSTVVVTRTVADPEAHRPGDPPSEVVLTVGWGAVGRLDLEPATCGDPSCDADHGYTGALTGDDFSLRVSAAAEGPDLVARVVRFGADLNAASVLAAAH